MKRPRLSSTELLAIIQPWIGVAEAIHRRVLHLTEATERTETIWIGCGSGRSVLWWAERVGGAVQGVDPDSEALEAADRAVRAAGLGRLVTLQLADPANLPHREAVFDLAIIRMLQCGLASGDEVVVQAAAVVRDRGSVIAILPTWFNPPSSVDVRRMTTLGIRPRQLMEWKAAFRAGGFGDLHVEETAPDGAWLASGWAMMVVRAWRVARWRGVSATLSPAFRSLRRLARTHRLGLSLIKGSRRPTP